MFDQDDKINKKKMAKNERQRVEKHIERKLKYSYLIARRGQVLLLNKNCCTIMAICSVLN